MNKKAPLTSQCEAKRERDAHVREARDKLNTRLTEILVLAEARIQRERRKRDASKTQAWNDFYDEVSQILGAYEAAVGPIVDEESEEPLIV